MEAKVVEVVVAAVVCYRSMTLLTLSSLTLDHFDNFIISADAVSDYRGNLSASVIYLGHNYRPRYGDIDLESVFSVLLTSNTDSDQELQYTKFYPDTGPLEGKFT